jgi:hypothetical protein
MRLLALLAVLFAAPLATAGECTCSNACPLAQTAHEQRSTGEEAVLASRVVRAEVVRVVVKNLASI